MRLTYSFCSVRLDHKYVHVKLYKLGAHKIILEVIIQNNNLMQFIKKSGKWSVVSYFESRWLTKGTMFTFFEASIVKSRSYRWEKNY